ncbi:MAG: hypothetical protein VZR73_07185 [Acutalibacteraceae bacterium]|nr:hypothetical protein [Acutalibacteraceae bacterium]
MELKKTAMADEKYVSCIPDPGYGGDGCDCVGSAASQSADIQSEY